MTAPASRWVPVATRLADAGSVITTCARTIEVEAPTKQRSKLLGLLPGLLAVAVLAVVATQVGSWLTLLGAPVAGILIGAALAHPLRSRASAGERLRPGVKLCNNLLLQLAVVLMGAQLSLGQVAEVGLSSLPVMLGTLSVCLFGAWLIGRALGIDPELRVLIGVGTGICGASAIAAVSPVIRARSANIAYAISTIFCFNIAAVLLFPPLGHLLGMSQEAFGMFAGTAVNDTSSVVAVAATYGNEASDQAVVVKLVRSLMIIPIVLTLGTVVARRSARSTDKTTENTTDASTQQSRGIRLTRLVPWFLVGFVVMVAANSAGVIPETIQPGVVRSSVFLITMALVSIGLSVDPGALRKAGPRPLLLGALLWLLVSTTSLLLQRVTM